MTNKHKRMKSEYSDLYIRTDEEYKQLDIVMDSYVSMIHKNVVTENYIPAMFFHKYICDNMKENNENYRKQYKDDEERIRRKLSREPYTIPKEARFDYLYENRNKKNLGELFNNSLKSIAFNSLRNMEGVFDCIDFNSEDKLGKTEDRNQLLKKLLENFNKTNMRPSNVSAAGMSKNFNDLLAIEDPTDNSYLPKLVAKLSNPKIHSRIYDPNCGSGRLLIETGKAVNDRSYALYGIENDRSKYALARMYLCIHPYPGSAYLEKHINPMHPSVNNSIKKYNNIVSIILKENKKSKLGNIINMTDTIDDKGNIIVAIPSLNLLYKDEQNIREKLIKDNQLDAVINLPKRLSLVVIDRSREKGGVNEDRKDVLFIDASQDHQPVESQSALTEDQTKRIIRTYKIRKNIKTYAHLANFDEIKKNKYCLYPAIYVHEVMVGEKQKQVQEQEQEQEQDLSI